MPLLSLRYVLAPKKDKWIKRTRAPRGNRIAIGRIFYVYPNQGEKYYLRMLLGHVRGAKSYEDIRYSEFASTAATASWSTYICMNLSWGLAVLGTPLASLSWDLTLAAWCRCTTSYSFVSNAGVYFWKHLSFGLFCWSFRESLKRACCCRSTTLNTL